MEKIYKSMGLTGSANIAIGIVMILIGVASGVLSIISGAHLLKSKKGLMF